MPTKLKTELPPNRPVDEPLDLSDPAYPEHTYIRRRGRMTRAQSRAMEELVDRFRSTAHGIAQSAEDRDIGIEIGFGMGQALLRWAQDASSWQLFGIELYQPGIGSLVDQIVRDGVSNIEVIETPAQQVLRDLAQISPGTVQEVRIFFPDPWPKKRHNKRRLVQPGFVDLLAGVVRANGCVRLATDWAPYAQWMRECFQISPYFEISSDNIRSAVDSTSSETVRDSTKFELRGERLGHDIHDMLYIRNHKKLATTVSR